ncbi:transglutaminase domain-containing protein [Candidatus Woesearchaeota archaeon]|nr:transglutaminase domain-containing protein [Candidatus Woesearchaeota archaeon]
MRLVAIILIFLLLIPFSIAQSEKINDYNDYDRLELEFNLDADIGLVFKDSNSKVKDVSSILTFFPREDIMQKVAFVNTYSDPNADVRKSLDEITFSWFNPDRKDLNFGINSEVSIENALVIVDDKITFPISDIDNQYTRATEFIDITPEIRKQAQEIVSGEDDAYVAVFKLGNWVNDNIKYDLSTLTADVVQKSSWVLQSRQGVCDELTNLFISMTRSLGIPARFVYGVAYTNTNYDWGPHGWAEVYLPGEGWIPFDVTYGQMGWVDPSHIKLKHNPDSGDPTIRYSWKSVDVSLEGKTIDLKTKVKNKGNKIDFPIDFKVKTLVNNVAPGSYVPIEVEIKNKNAFYFPNKYTIIKSTELLDDNHINVLLKPGQIKKIFWITKIPQNLEDNYIYTSLIEIEDQFHKKEFVNLTYANNLGLVSLDEAKNLIEENSLVEETSIVSKKLRFECDVPEFMLIYNEKNIDCSLKNLGNTPLNDLSVCIGKNCQDVDLSITEEKNLNFSINLDVGEHILKATARSKDINVQEILKFMILNDPGLMIESVNYPESVNYDENFNLDMIITSKVPVNDLVLEINGQKVLQQPSSNTISRITIPAQGLNLYRKDNDSFEVKISYKDINGKEYVFLEDYPINITNVPWYIKILGLFGISGFFFRV